jgi:hypothetical protein
MHRAKQEIFSVDVIDINHIGVCPAYWPRLGNHEPIAAVLKARCSCNYHRLADAKRVLPAKVGAEPVLRNASALLALNWLVVAIILARLLLCVPVIFVISVLIGLMVRALVLLFVFVLICAFIVLSIWLPRFLPIRFRALLFLPDATHLVHTQALKY